MPQCSVPNTCEQGAAARDALCKFLYARVFEWLVDRINASLIVSHQGLVKGSGESGGSDGEGTLTINILDIFGFEFFERNSFEQFCINYANEQLQHQFNSQMLKVEQDEYQAQQIPWEYVVYPDNQPCVSLIEARPGGMLALLDEEGRIPRGSDEGFMNKVREISSVCLSCPFARKNEFVIAHYAGSVSYDSKGFLEKNRDILLADLRELLRSSASEFVLQFLSQDAPTSSPSSRASSRAGSTRCSPVESFADQTAETGHGTLSTTSPILSAGASSEFIGAADRGKQQRRRGVTVGAETIGSQFRKQLSSLMATIAATDTHYIRCVNPNSGKAAQVLHQSRVVQQLRCSGLIQAIRLIRSSYPIRYSFTDLKHGFWAIFHCAAASRAGGSASSRGVTDVLPRLSALEPSNTNPGPDVATETGASVIASAADGGLVQGEVQDEVRMLLCETLGMQEGVGFAIGLTKAFFHTREAEFLLEVKVLVEQRATAALQPFFLGALARHRHARERAAVRVLQATVAAEIKWRAYTQQRQEAKACMLQAVFRRQLQCDTLPQGSRKEVWVNSRLSDVLYASIISDPASRDGKGNASASGPRLPKLSLVTSELGGRGDDQKGDTPQTPLERGGTGAPKQFSVPPSPSSQWGRALRPLGHCTPRIAEDMSEEGPAGAGLGTGSESVCATDTSCTGSEFSYSEVMYPKAAVKTIDGFLLSPRDHMEVAKRRKRAEIEQLRYDLEMMRVEKEMLLHEMHTKDEEHTKELAEMTSVVEQLTNELHCAAANADSISVQHRALEEKRSDMVGAQDELARL